MGQKGAPTLLSVTRVEGLGKSVRRQTEGRGDDLLSPRASWRPWA